jgi:hypothetical protein
MADKTWDAVDRYFLGKIIGQDAALEDAQRAADAAGLPPISVTAAQGKLLHLLVRMHGARKVLEIGTLAGYSTIWLGPIGDIQGPIGDSRLGTFKVLLPLIEGSSIRRAARHLASVPAFRSESLR